MSWPASVMASKSKYSEIVWLPMGRIASTSTNADALTGLPNTYLEEAITGNRHPLQARSAAWALLNDGIFANYSPVQRDVADLLTDDLTVRLAADHPDADVNFPRLAYESGGKEIATALIRGLETEPSGPLTGARATVLRRRLGFDPQALLDWWAPRFQAAIGTLEESAWLKIGRYLGVEHLPQSDVSRLTLGSPEQCREALWAGASPEAGTDADRQLLRAVLDGWCSDTRTSSTSEAGALLQAMRPQWFHQIGDSHLDGPAYTGGHLWLDQADRASRGPAWRRLLEFTPQYARLQEAADIKAGAHGAIAVPWGNAARELAQLHGPCWLASEIAIVGMASKTTGSGSPDRGGEPFGDNIDYETLIVEVRRRPGTGWWQAMHDRYCDPLSRRTWALALLATAATDIVIDHLKRIDDGLEGLSDHEFFAVASSSSRLGLAQAHRRLEPRIWDFTDRLGSRAKLLIAHFHVDPHADDLLKHLRSAQLASLASPEAFTWPCRQGDLRGRFASLCPSCRCVIRWICGVTAGRRAWPCLDGQMIERKRYPSDLTDERWALIEPVITAWKAAHPSVSGHQGGYELREIVNAILYQSRTGCQWDYLPHDLPPRSAAYYYFARWRDDGTDQAIHDLLRWHAREKKGRKADPSLVVLDTQSVHAASSVPADTTGKDPGKKVPGRKRCLAVDVLGLVVAVVVLAASAHENAAGIALLDRVAAQAGTVRKALVDQGFKSSVVSYGAAVGIDVQVVERNPADRGFVPQPKRWVVEQTFGILSFHRRLVRDYEHRLSSSASRVYWAMTDVMARRLTGTSTPSWRIT